VSDWDARARGEPGRITEGPDARLLTDNKYTNACRLVQPIVTEYRVVRNKGSNTSTAGPTEDESPPTPGRSDTEIGPPTCPVSKNQDVNVLIEEVPTLARSVAELQYTDPDIAAFVGECDARDIRYDKLAAADKLQVKKVGESKQYDEERVHRVRQDQRAKMLDNAESFPDSRPKRAHNTRALSPVHLRHLRQPNSADLDSFHSRSHSAPRTASRPSRDTHALSALCPQFGTSNKSCANVFSGSCRNR